MPPARAPPSAKRSPTSPPAEASTTCSSSAQDRTRRINIEGTLNLIQQLVDEGVKPVFFSSDNVFDGKTGLYDDESLPNPLNEYGRHKAEVELRVKDICQDGNFLIVRMSKVFSLNKGDGTLLDEMASTLHSGGMIQAADDQLFSPVLVSDVVNIVTALQIKNVTGVVNVSSPETWSRYDLALAMAQCMGIGSDWIQRISLDDLPEMFARPKNTTMKIDKMLRETEYEFKPLQYYIKQIAENWRGEINFYKEQEACGGNI